MLGLELKIKGKVYRYSINSGVISIIPTIRTRDKLIDLSFSALNTENGMQIINLHEQALVIGDEFLITVKDIDNNSTPISIKEYVCGKCDVQDGEEEEEEDYESEFGFEVIIDNKSIIAGVNKGLTNVILTQLVNEEGIKTEIDISGIEDKENNSFFITWLSKELKQSDQILVRIIKTQKITEPISSVIISETEEI